MESSRFPAGNDILGRHCFSAGFHKRKGPVCLLHAARVESSKQIRLPRHSCLEGTEHCDIKRLGDMRGVSGKDHQIWYSRGVSYA